MTPFDPSLDPQRYEATLTKPQIAARDYFVNEYMKDFDAFRACLRMGFMASFAIDQAKTFLQDGYVMRKIEQMTRTSVDPSPEDKAAMLANLRWLAHNGPPAVRATASQRYMEAQGYVKKDSDGAIERDAILAEMLRDFATRLPA
jgi:hypothetical protein